MKTFNESIDDLQIAYNKLVAVIMKELQRVIDYLIGEINKW